MKLNKDDKLLKKSLLDEIEGNTKTLQGAARTYINAKKASDLDLIDNSIQDLHELKNLLKRAN